ncbi:SAG1386/EF1546 family surface-associated protein [Lactobacillus sp. 3B(2020)]|uniref:SAG1386/EF1546 family surface-associated protein n=1 Tax=Lactobacillus sp. 3B(2020) TaxID=2695882 RepID=UPI0015DF8ADA|nr:SAG1386/EF1546 family surface-associated protein [Lactobacillus sp. 3B(2020)]QLL70113.1 LysM peptidoglycan-binding domain-containing protein [Lactobacillus sp. 3B(2020)]
MKRREDERNVDENLWDKTFEDNQDLGKDGHLSRIEHRKQSSANARFTTILVVLIIILAATPIIYWLNHEKSFNHPVQHTEQVAKASSNAKKKVHSATHQGKSATQSTKHSKAKSASSKKSQALSSSSSGMEASSSTSSSQNNSSSAASYVKVQAGQGIYRVAANNGLTVDELAQLNGISPSTKLYPGQQLRVK